MQTEERRERRKEKVFSKWHRKKHIQFRLNGKWRRMEWQRQTLQHRMQQQQNGTI